MSDTKISEAAVEAARKAFVKVTAWGVDPMRAALEAALPHLHPQPAELAFDVQAMLAACVPGGSIVDPQVVADNIRAWAAERKPAELAEQQGDARAQFEAWAQTKGMNTSRWKDGKYMSRYVHEKWEVWQSALAATGKQQVGEVQGGDALVAMDRVVAHIESLGASQIHPDYVHDARTARAALAARQPGAREPVGTKSVRQFIADRAPNSEHREDVLSGDYDHTDWFAHVAAALSQGEKS